MSVYNLCIPEPTARAGPSRHRVLCARVAVTNSPRRSASGGRCTLGVAVRPEKWPVWRSARRLALDARRHLIAGPIMLRACARAPRLRAENNADAGADKRRKVRACVCVCCDINSPTRNRGAEIGVRLSARRRACVCHLSKVRRCCGAAAAGWRLSPDRSGPDPFFAYVSLRVKSAIGTYGFGWRNAAAVAAVAVAAAAASPKTRPHTQCMHALTFRIGGSV